MLHIIKEGETKVIASRDLRKIQLDPPFASLAAALRSGVFGKVLRAFLRRGLFTLHHLLSVAFYKPP